MNRLNFFVYGILRKNERADLSKYCEFQGLGTINGKLFDIGECPALILDDDSSIVEGEIYKVSPEVIENIDKYESECGDYIKKEITVKLHNNQEVKALSYIYRNKDHLKDKQIINDGF